MTTAEKIRAEIARLRDVEKKATPAKWRCGGDEGWPIGSFSTGNSGIDGKDWTVWTEPMRASELFDSDADIDARSDAEFIVESRNTLPRLISALEGMLEALEGAEKYAHDSGVIAKSREAIEEAAKKLTEKEKLLAVAVEALTKAKKLAPQPDDPNGHYEECALYDQDDVECDCGVLKEYLFLDDALATIEGAKGSVGEEKE